MARLGDATWHPKRMTLGIKKWLTLSHKGEMIPWLILSHVSGDVIKENYGIKEKGWKMDSHTFGLRKEGRKLPPFDPYGQCSKKEERNEREKGRERRK